MATKPFFIKIKVRANSRISALQENADGTWSAQLKAPPVDGKANKELIGLLAERFACSKSAISIKSGVSVRLKLVRIEVA